MTGPPAARGLPQLLLVSAVVVLVSVGLARGVWVPNLHNALLAVAFTLVGSYVLLQRPGHPEGRLFLATGMLEAVLFAGRQVGHAPGDVEGARWWAWLGVWPVALALVLVTLCVLGFPDGRLASPRWRPVAAAVVVVGVVCAAMSALWPVEYDAAGLTLAHPIRATAPAAVASVWSALAHPAYVAFQVLWVVAVVVRWRSSGGHVRRQLTWLVLAASVALVALVAGLAAGTPTPGVLSAALVPLAAGWAIVHGQQVAAYDALTWLSRTGPEAADLPGDHARAVAEALGATGAVLWMGPGELHAIGVWPETGADLAPTTLADLRRTPTQHLAEVTRHGTVVGAVTCASTDGLTRAQERLLTDLAAQAALVIDHLTLADVIGRERRAGHLDGLSPRERDVLDLMARGLSNAAICAELHLSVKTVEPVVSTIFAKLDLRADAASNRRVLAVLAYLRT